MSMDAGSTRVPFKSGPRAVASVLVAAAVLVVGWMPVHAAATGVAKETTKERDDTPRVEIGRPARVVAQQVEETMRTTMDGAAFTVAVLDARRRAAEAERLRAAIAWVEGVNAANVAKAERDSVWDRIAACETGGNWSMRGSSYSGGVGFANTTWNAFGGREFASNAGLATREQQIIVAERVRDYGGYTGWGCAYTIGLLSR